MDFDREKLEQVVLALFQINLSDDSGRRAWKSLPWSVMDSLHQKGYISDPATKNKSVWLSEEGAKLSKELFEKLFAPDRFVWTPYEVAADRSGPVRTLPVTRALGFDARQSLGRKASEWRGI
jgi:hypothetical protein